MSIRNYIKIVEEMHEMHEGEKIPKQRIDKNCWDGYKKSGTKVKGGVKVNKCVPESVSTKEARGRAALAELVQKSEVDPHSLIYREADQNRTNAVREMFPAGDGYTPIVTVRTARGTEILNGHNRAEVARERGDRLPSVSINERQYDLLKSKGFDDTEISYAALVLARETDEARNIDSQFPGANVIERGEDAADILRDIKTFAPEPTIREGYYFSRLSYYL